jgi:hypothetical protein
MYKQFRTIEKNNGVTIKHPLTNSLNEHLSWIRGVAKSGFLKSQASNGIFYEVWDDKDNKIYPN